MRIPNTSQVGKFEDFLAGISKVAPVDTEFKVGQKVAFVNDYGVVFGDMEIIGFADDDSFYGQFIYLDSDSYWYPVAPGSLRPVDENGGYEVKEGEVVYQRGW